MFNLKQADPTARPYSSYGIARRPLTIGLERTPMMSATHSLSVLVVDDEPLIRWVLRRALGARGH